MTENINIPKGYKSSPVGIIPEDWEVKSFRDICKVNQGLQIPIDDRLLVPNENTQFYITNEFLKKNSKNKYFILNAPKSVQCNEEDVLMTRTGNTGMVVTGVAGVFHNNFFKIDYKRDKLKRDFLVLHLRTPKTQHNILVQAGNSTIPDLNHSDFYRLKIPLPPLHEQQKIAEILSVWDAAIEKQTALIEKLQLRKRGLMQQLLTGKVRLRSASGERFSGEWKKVKLGEIGKSYNGLTGKNKDDFGEGKPYISYMNIFNNTVIDISAFEYVNVDENEVQNKVKFGDVFFTVSSETQDEVGMSSVLLVNVEDTYLNSFCFGFRLHNFEVVSPFFISYYLRGSEFRKKIFKLSQGATRYNLSKEGVIKLEINIPSLPEQTAIAEALSTADKGIVAAKKKLEQMKMQKKGLLQVLLSGKKRVEI